MSVIPASGINFGFTGSDVFSNAVLIVGSLATFIILGLAVQFTPRIISIIRGVFGRGRA